MTENDEKAPLDERLNSFIEDIRQKVSAMPPGKERDEEMKKIDAAEHAKKFIKPA